MTKEFELDYIRRKIKEYRKRLRGIPLQVLIKETEKKAEGIPKPEENRFGIENPMDIHTRLKGLEKFLEWEKRFNSLIKLEDLSEEEIDQLCHRDLVKIDYATYFSGTLISFCLIDSGNKK